MKKTLLAMTITGLFAATAQAATVYDADGTTLAIGGDVEINLSKAAADGSETVMSVDDADIAVTLTQAVQDGLAVFGTVELSADSSGTADLDQAIVGLASDEMGTIAFGQQYTIYDDQGIFNDYKLGAPGVVAGANAYGQQVVKYKYANDSIYAGIAYAMNTDATESVDGELNAIDGNIGFTGVENLDVALYLGSTDVTTDEALTYAQIQGSYTMDALKLSVIAATSSYDGDDAVGYGAQVAYTMGKATYSVGAASYDADVDALDVTGYFAGVGYDLSSNAVAYAQIGGDDTDDSELAYAVGIDMFF